MKMKSMLYAGICLISLAVGCGKEDASGPASVPNAPEVPKAVSDPVAPSGKVAADQAQGLIDKATRLVADSKYDEAMNSLKQLSELKLTAEQQKLVEDLRSQVQKALAKTASGESTKAYGELVPK